MRRLNIFIFALFSLSGAVLYKEKIAEDIFTSWFALYSFVPYAIFSGILLLAVSTINRPYKNWCLFDLSKFLFNPNHPHIFMASAGSIFVIGGIIGIILAVINGLPISKFSGMLTLFGLAYALPASMVCIWLNGKKDA